MTALGAELKFWLSKQAKDQLVTMGEKEGLGVSEMGRRAVKKFLEDPTVETSKTAYDAKLKFKLSKQAKDQLVTMGEREGLGVSEMGRRAIEKFVKSSTFDAPMPGYETDTVTRIESNLDDLSPQVLGAVMQQLLAAGALDVWFTPVQMKKSRPGVMLSTLCEEGATEKLADIIFSETTAFGLRVEKIQRLKLTRRFETVKTRHGDVTVKLGFKDGRLLQIAPEFECCRATAERAGVTLREVHLAALESARAAFGRIATG